MIALTIICLFGGCARTFWTDDNIYVSPGDNMGNNDTFGNNYAYRSDTYGNGGKSTYGAGGRTGYGTNDGIPNLPVVTDNIGNMRTDRNVA